MQLHFEKIDRTEEMWSLDLVEATHQSSREMMNLFSLEYLIENVIIRFGRSDSKHIITQIGINVFLIRSQNQINTKYKFRIPEEWVGAHP